ncbi:MAG: hypothetical protein WCK98_01325 [bacterium]
MKPTKKIIKSEKAKPRNIFRLATLFIDIVIHTLILLLVLTFSIQEAWGGGQRYEPYEMRFLLIIISVLYSYNSIYINILLDFFALLNPSIFRKILFLVFNILPLIMFFGFAAIFYPDIPAIFIIIAGFERFRFETIFFPEYSNTKFVLIAFIMIMPFTALAVSIHQFINLKYHSKS